MMVTWNALATLVLVLVIAPALPGIATKTKSVLTGRQGAPVLQLYYDLAKLLRNCLLYTSDAADE